jgi:uncharacterized protein YndB with AHSA1/START domain
LQGIKKHKYIAVTKAMKMEKFIKNVVTINAPAAKVWNTLVNPEQTKKYMFGCEALSDWKPGSPLIWKMIYEGKDFIPVKGHVVAIEPEKMLEYTVIDPHAAMEDIPENYLNVIYELSAKDNQTVLTVTQGDFAKVADGEKRYQDSYNNGEGWNPILVEIKKVAEEL